MTIKIIETGGTIDKEYNPIDGELEFPNKHIEEMLRRCRVTENYFIESIKLIDSLNMSEDEREELIKKCVDSTEEKILISHGTDTMVETANLIASKNINKTIVLFGAMIPYKVVNSDALFNLGFAFSSVQTKSSGVYIAMNGKIFDSASVKKNKEKGIFELI